MKADAKVDLKADESIVEHGELLLSQLLRAGVLISAAVILLGVVMLFASGAQTGYFSQGISGMIGFPPRAGGPPVDSSVSDVLAGLSVGEPDAVISLGLLLLIATPIMRVAASVFLFLMQRDYRYVAITMFVLIVLLTALRIGTAG